MIGSKSRSVLESRPVFEPIVRTSLSCLGASPHAWAIEMTPRRDVGGRLDDAEDLAWPESISITSPLARPSASRSSGCMNAGL